MFKKLLNITDQDNVECVINDADKSLTIFVNKEDKNEMESH